MIKLVNLYKEYQSIKPEFNKKLDLIIKNSSYIQGKLVQDLESKLAKYKKANYCSTCGNGTDALIVAIKSLNLPPNSEVIVPAYSWISTASSVLLNNLKIKFVDIDLNTGCLNIDHLKKNISKKTKLIILVDLYGNSVPSNKLKSICKKNRIYLIIDGAQSLGSINDNSYFDIYTTSFFPAKSLGCLGDGGAIFTNNKDLNDEIVCLKKNGQYKRYDAEKVGINSRLDSIQAAVLIEKLKIYNSFIQKRKKIAKFYTSKLSNIRSKVKLVMNLNQKKNAFTNFPILIQNRDSFVQFMKKKQIEVGINYPIPLTSQNAFKQFSKNNQFPNSDFFSKHVATLPINPFLRTNELNKIINCINIFIKSQSN